MVYFVRHGESQANHKGVFAGQRDDSPLTDNGLAQAKALVTEIRRRNIQVDQILHSPLKRAIQTTEIIARELGLPASRVTPDKRLAEYDMGGLTGTPLRVISSAELTAHPEAEDPHSFRSRILEAIEDAEALPGTTLVVSHMAVGKMLIAARRNVDPMDFYDIRAYSNAEVVELPTSKMEEHRA